VVPAVGVAVATCETGQSDVTISADVFVHAGGLVALVARLTDPSNYWMCYAYQPGTVTLFEVIGGVFNARGSATPTILGAHAFKLLCVGNVITVFWDNVPLFSFSPTATGLTATQHGVYAENETTLADSWDNFLITHP